MHLHSSRPSLNASPSPIGQFEGVSTQKKLFSPQLNQHYSHHHAVLPGNTKILKETSPQYYQNSPFYEQSSIKPVEISLEASR